MFTGVNFVQLDTPKETNTDIPSDTLTGTSEKQEIPEEKIVTSPSTMKDWLMLNRKTLIITAILVIGLIGFMYYKKNTKTR